MTSDCPRYDRAVEAATRIFEALERAEDGTCRAIIFGRVLFLVLEAIYAAEDDARQRDIAASRN